MGTRTRVELFCDLCGITILDDNKVKAPHVKAEVYYSKEFLGDNAGTSYKFVDLCNKCNHELNESLGKLIKERYGKMGSKQA